MPGELGTALGCGYGRVRSSWLSPSFHPKLAGQLWLSFFTPLWLSSFPIGAGESPPSLLGNCIRSSRFSRRSRVWVAAADVPGGAGATGREIPAEDITSLGLSFG